MLLLNVECIMYCSVGVVKCCIVDRSNGIVECIVVLLVVIVKVHQTEVLKRQWDVLTSLRQFAYSSRGSRNGSCVDCGLNEYWIILVIRILLLMDLEDLRLV